MDRLTVAIVAWRSADLTIDCLLSIAKHGLQSADVRVIVVDNDSQDGTAERIDEAINEHGWSSWCTLIRAPRNGGFAAGNNIAIRAMLASEQPSEFVLLLNPDTIVRPHAFSLLLDYMHAHPEVGIAGGRSEDPDGTPQMCCFRFPRLASELLYYLRFGLLDRLFSASLTRLGTPESACEVDWVSGAFMIIRRRVLGDVGLMDEGYFLYFEETDLTLRARRAGWRCAHVPQSRVVHLVGQSSGVSSRDPSPQRRPAYWFESRRRFFVVNYGLWYAIATDLLVIVAFASWRLRRFLQRKPDPDSPHFLADFIRHSSLVKGARALGPPRGVY